ncbi:MAG: hypothetical protein IT342_20395 [Candidatus Melainabacteria bacterium]|nr:hypothetical protein [Candidatus Melainabacteria bacterium]
MIAIVRERVNSILNYIGNPAQRWLWFLCGVGLVSVFLPLVSTDPWLQSMLWLRAKGGDYSLNFSDPIGSLRCSIISIGLATGFLGIVASFTITGSGKKTQ